MELLLEFQFVDVVSVGVVLVVGVCWCHFAGLGFVLVVFSLVEFSFNFLYFVLTLFVLGLLDTGVFFEQVRPVPIALEGPSTDVGGVGGGCFFLNILVGFTQLFFVDSDLFHPETFISAQIIARHVG